MFDILSSQKKIGIWITAAYIPERENLDEDEESRKKHENRWNGC